MVDRVALRPATIEAVRLARMRGHFGHVHPTNGNARWVFLLDGSFVTSGTSSESSATWSFVVFERIGEPFYLVGFRSGAVPLAESNRFCLGSLRVTNNTGEMEAFGHALGWAFFPRWGGG